MDVGMRDALYIGFRYYWGVRMSPNMKAFLDTIAFSEIGPALLSISDNGFNVCVGSTPSHPILFDDYSTHPRRHDNSTNSDAAGRYQFMGRYWPAYQTQLKLPDFGPESQDRWCIKLIQECHAQDDIELGNFAKAITKCKSRWASFPGAGYGQRENDISALINAYVNSGGVLA